jgi:hypothetical protein
MEEIMGTTLHNKIYLGRGPRLGSRRVQALLTLGTMAAAGLAWIALRTLK